MPELTEVFVDPRDAKEYGARLDALWYHSLVEAQEAITSAKVIIKSPVDWLEGISQMVELR